MAALKNKDGTHLYIDCNCGCGEGIRFVIDREDYDYYCLAAYTNGNFYTEQGGTLRNKLKKIWAIIRNNDYYYSDIIMTQDDFNAFKEYINSI